MVFQVERDKMNKYGRPLLGCTIAAEARLIWQRIMGVACYEGLRGGLWTSLEG